MVDLNLVFADGELNDTKNWFFTKYYYAGSNARYWTFQTALNLLNQQSRYPVILETGCQRQKDDLGGGMSTSIFAEYVTRYGGEFHTIDNNNRHLTIARECTREFSGHVEFHLSDSVKFLSEWKTVPNLVYLDSYDYPCIEILNKYGSQTDIVKTEAVLRTKQHKDIFNEFESLVRPCQQHCVNEFLAIEPLMQLSTILLIDDNRLIGGGKSGLLKPLLVEKGWTCLMDFQQTLWIRGL